MKPYTEPPLTIAALESTPDDGNRYELIEGELYVSSAPNFFHQTVLTRLMDALLAYLRKRALGQIVPGVGIVFDDFNGVIPDLVFLSHERKKRILKGGRLTGAPEIVIEILSPGASNERRDREVKRALYSHRGVTEYWIVDPEARTVELYRKQRTGGFGPALLLQADDELTSSVLPGFRLPLAGLFDPA
jgi:Uma2 family endonuclease